jgi:hypothetical protein
VPGDHFYWRMSMAMPDALLKASGKPNVPIYSSRTAPYIAVFVLEPR